MRNLKGWKILHSPKNRSAAFLVALIFAVGTASARQEPPQQTGDQPKADANATKEVPTVTKKEPKKKAVLGSSAAAAPSARSAAPAMTNAPPNSASKPATTQKPTPPASNAVTVWVNTDSSIYHKPGTRWYGKTKHGRYMTEANAIRAGYHAAAKE